MMDRIESESYTEEWDTRSTDTLYEEEVSEEEDGPALRQDISEEMRFRLGWQSEDERR